MGLLSSIFGGAAQKKAAKKNIKQFGAARDASLAEYAPYAAAGKTGLSAYLDSIGLGDSDAAIARFQASPEYQLNYKTAMDAGTQGVQDTAQAGGTYNSGRTLKALQDRAQQTSSGFFSDYLKGLAGITDTGYNTAGADANIRSGYATNIADANTQLADAKTSQYQGFDSLLSGGLKLIGGFGGTPSGYNYSNRGGFY